jgi:hypothetical protein
MTWNGSQALICCKLFKIHIRTEKQSKAKQRKEKKRKERRTENFVVPQFASIKRQFSLFLSNHCAFV